jgi:hypothetical protein
MDINKVTPWFRGSYMYQEGDRQLELARVAGGLIFPFGTNAGFAVVAALERFQNIGFSCRRAHLLLEIEEYDFENLIRQCLNLSQRLEFQNWYGHTSQASMVALHAFNREQAATYRPQFNLMSAPFLQKDNAADTFRYGLERIRERTLPGKKTLELSATPKIQSALTMIPPESATGAGIENYPAVAALTFLLAALDFYNMGETRPEQAYTDNSMPRTWRGEADSKKKEEGRVRYYGRR